jgi:N6-L-threonylcarbamoyladenine synthase
VSSSASTAPAIGSRLSEDLFPNLVVLGIETSCDETSAGVVRGGTELLSNVVASQVDFHKSFGGVVPEVAARAHAELLDPVIREALRLAGIAASEIDVVAVTAGPGLAGSLVVGVSAAKGLALALEKPLVAVNHLEGHIFAVFPEYPDFRPPAVALIVSGGHTMLVHIEALGRYAVLGETLDDAVGEAFDKVARLLGYGFPGGPEIDKAARSGDPARLSFPRPMLGQGLDFSMSGLKTAVVSELAELSRKGETVRREDVAASFQEAAVDVQVEKLVCAALQVGVENVLVCGGVAANSRLRAKLEERCSREGLELFVPSPKLCTDNGAMIAACGAHVYRREGPAKPDFGPDPSLRSPLTRSSSDTIL